MRVGCENTPDASSGLGLRSLSGLSTDTERGTTMEGEDNRQMPIGCRGARKLRENVPRSTQHSIATFEAG